MVLVACSQGDQAPAGRAPERRGPFGSLRDFVLVERPRQDAGDALFVDRFEVTRADWADFAATTQGTAVVAGTATISGDGSLPVGQVDLHQARAFARWRFARLPTADEWSFVCVGERTSQLPWDRQSDSFPWGSREDPTRANTSELGIGDVTPVGTFESGRRSGGDAPYDLIGNVSEWTESVSASWCSDDLDPVASLRRCHLRVLGTPALGIWQGPGGLLPIVLAAEAGGSQVPHVVLGSDFKSPMAQQVENVPAGDRRRSTGLRLFTTAKELLVALAAHPGALATDDAELLRRFLHRGHNAEILGPVWRSLREQSPMPGHAPDRAPAAAESRPTVLGMLDTELSGGGH